MYLSSAFKKTEPLGMYKFATYLYSDQICTQGVLHSKEHQVNKALSLIPLNSEDRRPKMKTEAPRPRPKNQSSKTEAQRPKTEAQRPKPKDQNPY